MVVALVVRVGARRNRRWSSYNSIFYFVAFAEVFAGCGGPLPHSLPSCRRYFSYWKAQCRMNAFAYLQISLCSSHCICICVSAAVAAAAALSVSRSSSSPSSSWGVWRASTVAQGAERGVAGAACNVFCILCGFWYVHCEFIEGDFIAQTNVAFYKCFKSRPKDGAY